MTSTMMGTSSLAKLEEIKQVIRSLLIAMGNRDVTLPQLQKLYKEAEDNNIPFRDFYYTNLKDFLSSMPDVVQLRYNGKDQLCAYHVSTEKSRHISRLVAKARKTSPSRNLQAKYRLRCRNNPIDPRILSQVLLKLMTENLGTSKRNQINKSDVLAGVMSHIGAHGIYTRENLDCQLNELSHILNHNETYIFPKNNLVTQMPSNSSDLKEVSNKNWISEFIKDSTKDKVGKLMEKYPKGIWSWDFPKFYQREYGMDLEYMDLGFNSIIEFVGALPSILKIVSPENSKKQMIVNAKTFTENVSNHSKSVPVIFQKPAENTVNDSDAIPSRLSPRVTKSLIPEGVMNLDEAVDQILVSSLLKNQEEGVDVTVTELGDPSTFWVVLRKNKKKLEKLMNQLDEFYSQPNLDKYKIPHVALDQGLHIACRFAKQWHRAIIESINGDGVQVHFYDYGTIKTYNPNKLYFLDRRFSSLAAQAIPCSLHNVIPTDSNVEWPSKASKEFHRKVFDKDFIAVISTIDEETNSMVVNLIDVSKEDVDKYINKWLVDKKLANWGELIRTRTNISFRYHQYCIQKRHELLNSDSDKIECVKKEIIHNSSNNSSDSLTNRVSHDEKWRSINQYKARFSNSPRSSYHTCASDDSILEKNSYEEDSFKSCQSQPSMPIMDSSNDEENRDKIETFPDSSSLPSSRSNDDEDDEDIFKAHHLNKQTVVNEGKRLQESGNSSKDFPASSDSSLNSFNRSRYSEMFKDRSDLSIAETVNFSSRNGHNNFKTTLHELRKLMTSTSC